ncbi:MAG TPA: YdcF family protein [Bryobacteraceae bacterium]|nr:YdcF family protein [Bryobacteraceae bacterium]
MLRLVRRALLWGALALAAIALIRWQAVLNWFGNYLVCSDPRQPADLAVVMGGDFWGPRVLTGAQIGAQGLAPLVLISGPPYAGRPEGELAVEFLVKQGYPRSLFAVFAHEQPSTLGEVLALRGELMRRGVKRVIVVTSSFHSRRCVILFRLFCPGIRFLSVPAPDPAYHPNGWWKDASSRQLFFSEWTKIPGSVLIAYAAKWISGWRQIM